MQIGSPRKRPVLFAIVAASFALAVGVAFFFFINATPRECLGRQYEDRDDRWDYKGDPGWLWEWYRDHDVIFHGNHVPVPSGTVVRVLSEKAIMVNYPEIEVRGNDIHMRLEGDDAALFAVEYHPNYQFNYNRWRGLPDMSGYTDSSDLRAMATAVASNICVDHCKAIWHIPDKLHPGVLQVEAAFKGHVITTVQDLPEGEYEFDLHIEFDYGYGFDCGQGDPEPREFRVIVDRDIPTVPPAPADVQVSERDDGDGWMVSWTPVDGTEYYRVSVSLAQPDERLLKENPGYFGIVESLSIVEPPYHLMLADVRSGCGNLLELYIYALGDGITYLRDYGGISETVLFHAPACLD